VAGGDYSFAGGRYAVVRDDDSGSPYYSGDIDGDEGTFVWADSTHSSGDRFISTGPNQFLISAAGGVGIGTNAPDASLHVVDDGSVNGLQVEGGADGAHPNIRLQEDGGASANLRLNESGSDRLEVQMNDVTRMSISQSGLVGIGSIPTSDYQLFVAAATSSGAIRALSSQSGSFAVSGLNTNSTGTGVIGNALSSTGVNYGVRGVSNSTSGFDFYASGAGTNYGSSSSRRWKSNIREIGGALQKVKRLRGVYFDWDAEHGGHHDVGMIAEEVGKVLPEIVVFEENRVDAIGMDYSKMAPLLVEAIKAQSVEISNLSADLERLDRAIAALQSKEAE
jgi:hypothetical protein